MSRKILISEFLGLNAPSQSDCSILQMIITGEHLDIFLKICMKLQVHKGKKSDTTLYSSLRKSGNFEKVESAG